MALVRSSRSLGRAPDQTSCLHQFPSIERRWVHQTCCIARISSQNSAQEYRLCRARQDNHRPYRQNICTYKSARRRRGSGRSSFTAVPSSQFDTTSGSDAQVRLIAQGLRQRLYLRAGLYLLACFTCWSGNVCSQGDNTENNLPEQQLDTNVWAYKPFW